MKVGPNPALHYQGAIEGIWEQLLAIQSFEQHEVQWRDPIIRGPISAGLTSELVLHILLLCVSSPTLIYFFFLTHSLNFF